MGENEFMFILVDVGFEQPVIRPYLVKVYCIISVVYLGLLSKEYGERRRVFHCWWDSKLVKVLWQSIWQFLRKLEIVLPEGLAILLLGIHPKDTPPYHKVKCFTVFTAALFCPRQKLVHLHNKILFNYF